jgi:hypothetical protein
MNANTAMRIRSTAANIGEAWAKAFKARHLGQHDLANDWERIVSDLTTLGRGLATGDWKYEALEQYAEEIYARWDVLGHSDTPDDDHAANFSRPFS